jgi:hypothetical protein
MMKPYILVIAVMFMAQIGQAQKKQNSRDTLFASALRPFGRVSLTGNQLELISSAAHLGFKFEGSQCAVYAWISNSGTHNYIQYELDGSLPKTDPDKWWFKRSDHNK